MSLVDEYGEPPEEFNDPPEDPWRVPEEIRPELTKVPKLDLDLPQSMAEFIHGHADLRQCAPDYVAAGLIVTLSSAVGARLAIRPGRHNPFTVVPNLWGAGVGTPSVIKSSAIDASVNLLLKKEEPYYQEYRESLRSYKFEEDIFKAEVTRITKEGTKDRDAKEAAQAALNALEAPERPRQKRLVVTDITIEKLYDLLAENPDGLLYYRDELDTLFKSWIDPRRQSDRKSYMELWEGTRTIPVDRIGRDASRIERGCLAMIGSIQPGVIQKLAKEAMDEGGGNDGLLPRFQVMVYPDPVYPENGLPDAPYDFSVDRTMSGIISGLVDTNYMQAGAQSSENIHRGIPYIHMTERGFGRFNEWLVASLKDLKAPGVPSAWQGHIGKYRSLIPSLALIFHLVDWQHHEKQKPLSSVDIEQVERAIGCAEYLQAHAKRIYSLELTAPTRAVHTLADRLRAGALQNGFTLRDVYRPEWAGLKDRKTAAAAIREMLRHGWIKAKQTGKQITYDINPKVTNEGESTWTWN